MKSTDNQIVTSLFKELSKELILTGVNCFTYEPTDLIEIDVNIANENIRVSYWRTSNHMRETIKVEHYHSLHGMMGYSSVEDKFNEIIKSL